LQIGGKPLPLFVLQTDVVENVIYVGQGDNHWGLISSGLFIRMEEAHWVRPSLKQAVLESAELQCRFRYRQALVGCKLLALNGGYQVVFGAPDKAVTAGQFVAIYWNDEIVFSGAIA
jgi:tRNA-specific 2-thiouridylase